MVGCKQERQQIVHQEINVQIRNGCVTHVSVQVRILKVHFQDLVVDRHHLSNLGQKRDNPE